MKGQARKQAAMLLTRLKCLTKISVKVMLYDQHGKCEHSTIREAYILELQLLNITHSKAARNINEVEICNLLLVICSITSSRHTVRVQLIHP